MNSAKLTSLLVVLLASVAAPAFGQSSPAPSKPSFSPIVAQAQPLDLGVLNGVNYVNGAFGLSMSIPGDWIVVSEQRTSEIAAESNKLLKSESEQKREQLRRSIERSTVLISLTKFPAGLPNNASFMLVAERVNPALIRNGVDGLMAMRSTAEGSFINLEFQGGIRTQRIGGADFGAATIRNSSVNGVYMQKVYMTVKNGYGLEFFFTYLQDADVAAFDSIMKSVNFK